MKANHGLRGLGIAAIVCCMTALAAPEARAMSLSFDTNDSQFANGSATFTDTTTFGSLTVKFTPNSVSSGSVSNGDSVLLGKFEVSTSNFYTGALGLAQGFTLTINQTDPVLGSNSASAVLQGFLVFLDGGYAIDFGQSNASVNVPVSTPNVNYALQDLKVALTTDGLDGGLLLLSPDHATELRAVVTGHGLAAVPEPSTIALALTGFGTFGLVRFRRQRALKASAA